MFRFGLSNQFDTEFPAALTGKVSLGLFVKIHNTFCKNCVTYLLYET